MVEVAAISRLARVGCAQQCAVGVQEKTLPAPTIAEHLACEDNEQDDGKGANRGEYPPVGPTFDVGREEEGGDAGNTCNCSEHGEYVERSGNSSLLQRVEALDLSLAGPLECCKLLVYSVGDGLESLHFVDDVPRWP